MSEELDLITQSKEDELIEATCDMLRDLQKYGSDVDPVRMAQLYSTPLGLLIAAQDAVFGECATTFTFEAELIRDEGKHEDVPFCVVITGGKLLFEKAQAAAAWINNADTIH